MIIPTDVSILSNYCGKIWIVEFLEARWTFVVFEGRTLAISCEQLHLYAANVAKLILCSLVLELQPLGFWV